jgi:O-antigen ligase
VSVAWSADVPLTVRRVGVLVCFSIGALGVGRSFTLRQLCIMSVAISGTYLAIGLADEILQGVFQPLAPAYRFTGHVHPNLQASFCAAICLGSLCLMDRRDSLRYALAVCAAVGLIFLILTKSRTASIAFVAACAVIAAYRVSRRQALVIGISAGFLLGVVVLAASVAGIDLERTVVHTVLIGRTDDAMSLTGRVPLWHQLLATVNERILTGFGVGAYWTPQHIHLASAVVGSGVTHAHCAYIEAVLNVGIVGLIAYLLTAGAAVREIFRRCNVHAEGGILFLAALMAFAFVHACAEALFVSTSILPFFAAAGLVHLAFHPEELPSRRHGPAVSDRASPADADVALSGSPRT